MARKDGDFAPAGHCKACNAKLTVGDEGQCPNPDCPTSVFRDRRGEK
jgi:hypothetical protein